MAENKIIEVGKRFYLIKSNEKDFHRNIYFKRFANESGKAVNMIMDPGTKTDLPNLLETAKRLFGGIQNTHLIFLSHQDPDLTSVVPVLMATAPKAKIISSIDTWRLLKMYGGIPEKRFIAIEDFKSDVLNIKATGHKIKFVSARYCHFRGAMMFFDYETNILFTGDFAGGVDTRKGEGVYATEESWDGISLFHQIYMPTNVAIKETIDRITLLSPLPEIIAPQHGDVIKGDLVTEFLSRLYDLEVGIDLIHRKDPAKELAILAINAYLDQIKETYKAFYIKLINSLKKSSNFTSTFIFTEDSITDLKLTTTDALKIIWDKIDLLAQPQNVSELRTYFVSALEQYDVSHPFVASSDEEEAEIMENPEAVEEDDGELFD